MPVPSENITACDPFCARPSFSEAFKFWVKLGWISFGGPAGQIAIMHRELVEKRKWITHDRFLHALNYCMLLPGPEAQQLAIYIGWLLHRTWGGIVAGAFFVIPSIFILWGLSYVYVTYQELFWVRAIFYGLKPAVVAVIASAVLSLGSKALKNKVMWGIAAVAFIAIFFFDVKFPVIVLTFAIFGFFGGKFWKDLFSLTTGDSREKAREPAVLSEAGLFTDIKPSLARSLKIGLIGLLLWWTPVFLVFLWLGSHHTLFQEGIFFSKVAMVTFGGAYAVLSYVSQLAVGKYQWLTAEQMLDGLGLAETTPGPLIMVLQFVGFLGGYFHPGTLSPLCAATLGALITTWTTFVPSFLWIFLGAPYIEQVRGNVKLTAALSAVTAAVVGVILNLAVWFGWHVFVPRENYFDWFALFLSLIVFIGMQKWRWDIVPVLLGSGCIGILYQIFR